MPASPDPALDPRFPRARRRGRWRPAGHMRNTRGRWGARGGLPGTEEKAPYNSAIPAPRRRAAGGLFTAVHSRPLYASVCLAQERLHEIPLPHLHHRRGLPFRERVRSWYPCPVRRDRGRGRRGDRGDQLWRPEFLRAAAEPRQRFILSIDDEEFDVDSPEDVASAIRTCAPSSASCAFATPTSRSTCMARRARPSTSRTTSCANCTASSTCSRTRPSSWRAIIREAQLRGQPAAAVLPRAGEVRAGRLVFLALPRPLRRRGLPESPWARCSTSSSARTCCAPTSATPWMNWASCWTTPARWPSRAERRAHLPRRPLLLRDQRHVHLEQGGVARQRRRRRRGRGGPQLPQVDPARHHHDGRDPGVPAPTRNHLGIIGRSRWKNSTRTTFARRSKPIPSRARPSTRTRAS